ncbi:hypothetical protein ALC56_05736 [Trachymyrmex septentrionalis]|uniref:Uncharacterized protein n=1 Tax=Trachymyrmex septentrionalis TaxID=34720 RepID=A0A195FHW4_9HYME|nr:hypothetical protein ALC56_05736 [Trachymyrmex septentrionalis]
MVSNLGAANQTAAHQTRLKHGDEFLPDRPSKAPRSVTSSTFSKRSSGSSTNKGHFTPAFKALINAEKNIVKIKFKGSRNHVYRLKRKLTVITVRTYRLYLMIVGGHHNPRSNIATIEPAIILHSRGRSCKKCLIQKNNLQRETTASRTSREDEEEHVWTYLRIRQRWHYPETGMTPLASRCDETTTLLLLLLLELAPGARCYSRAAATSASSLPR